MTSFKEYPCFTESSYTRKLILVENIFPLHKSKMQQVPILILTIGLLLVVGPSTAKYLLVDIVDGINDELPGTILTQDSKGILHLFIT